VADTDFEEGICHGFSMFSWTMSADILLLVNALVVSAALWTCLTSLSGLCHIL
jgi:hypothetical protein